MGFGHKRVGCVCPWSVVPPGIVSWLCACLSHTIICVASISYAVRKWWIEKLKPMSEIISKLDSLHWLSQCRSQTQILCVRCIQCDVSSACMALFTFCVMRHDSAKCQFWGLCSAHSGGYYDPPNSNSVEIFVWCTYREVSSSCVYSFRSYRVDKHSHKQTNKPTHKQTDSGENIQRFSLCYGINYDIRD